MNRKIPYKKGLTFNTSFNVNINRFVDEKQEEEEEETCFNSKVEEDYQFFIESCGYIKENEEAEISLIDNFVSLFSQNDFLSIEPLLETNFINSVLSQILSIINYNSANEDFSEEDSNDQCITEKCSINPEITSVLLQSLSILLSYIMFDSMFPIEDIVCLLIKLISFSDDQILALSLDCLYKISNKNIMNRIFISTLNQEDTMQYNEYILLLWEIFNIHLSKTNQISYHICQAIVKMYGTFYTNIEEEILFFVFEKLKLILIDSKEFRFDAIEEIEKFLNSTTNLKILANSHINNEIQKFLCDIQNQYEDDQDKVSQLINELEELYLKDHEISKKLIFFENSTKDNTFSFSDFELFLNRDIPDEYYYNTFIEISSRMNNVIQGQIKSMIILNRFADQSMFQDFDCDLLINIVNNFDYERSEDLITLAFHFIRQIINGFPEFRSSFFSENNSCHLLTYFSSRASYECRIEAGFLFSRLIRISDKEFINNLIEAEPKANIVNKTIKMITKFQDMNLFSDLIEAFIRILDLDLGDKILEKLQSVIDDVQEMADEANNKEISLKLRILLRKIQAASNQSNNSIDVCNNTNVF